MIRGVLLTFALCFVCSQSAHADGASDATAQQWFERGLTLSRSRAWEEARDAYLRSLDLEPRVSTHFNLAVVTLKLEHGRETILALDDFTRLADPRLHQEFLAQSIVMRARALDLTGELDLSIEPQTSLVRVDEETRLFPPSAVHALHLDPGLHHVHVHAPGFIAANLEVEIARGERRAMTLALEQDDAAHDAPLQTMTAQEVATPPRVTNQATPHEDRRWARRLWWTGSALVLAAVVTTAIVVVARNRNDSDRDVASTSTGIFFHPS